MFFMYPATFSQEGKNYNVDFPDLEGCHTWGDSFEDAYKNAQEAMELTIESILLDEEGHLPQPSELSKLKESNDDPVVIVTSEFNPYESQKAVKKTLTIPGWLNDKALAMGINFSQTLQDALMQKVVKYE